MKKSFAVVGAVLLTVSVAAATDIPKMETFLGYNYVRFNPNSDFFPSFNGNGGGGQAVYNVNKWIGGVFDLGAVTNGSLLNSSADTTVLNFVAGPRFTFRNESRFTPYCPSIIRRRLLDVQRTGQPASGGLGRFCRLESYCLPMFRSRLASMHPIPVSL